MAHQAQPGTEARLRGDPILSQPTGEMLRCRKRSGNVLNCRRYWRTLYALKDSLLVPCQDPRMAMGIAEPMAWLGGNGRVFSPPFGRQHVSFAYRSRNFYCIYDPHMRTCFLQHVGLRVNLPAGDEIRIVYAGISLGMIGDRCVL